MLSQDTILKYIAALVLFLGPVAGWHFGKKQEVAAAREKADKDAKNAAGMVEAAEKNADAALMTAAIMGGKETLKTLLDGARSIQDLTKQVQEQAQQLGEFKYFHAEELGKIRLDHQKEIASLNEKIAGLTADLEILRKELQIKEEALKLAGLVKEERDRLLQEKALLEKQVEDYRLANSSFIHLWQEAMKKGGDGGEMSQVNIAEQAIRRILEHEAELARERIMHGQQPNGDAAKAVSNVAVAFASHLNSGANAEPAPEV